MNLFSLQRLTDGLIAQRDEHLRLCRESLTVLYVSGHAMAQKFNEQEMLVLAETFRRLPWRDLHHIEVTDSAADPGETPSSFQDYLAGHLETLALCGSDRAFKLPGTALTVRQQFAETLADKVRRLAPDQGVALQVVLEAGRAIPAAVIAYANWWYPGVMLRLLNAPEYDWPRDVIP